tara:strand:- start:30754 stop:33282 length:2529 start_codon:yes stop_codon:yes gene_type:complete
MKKITLTKSLIFFISLFCAVNYGFGQVKLAELTFETPGGYSTSTPEYIDIINGANHDYFTRTNGSSFTFESFSNIQGSYYFAAQDIDNNNTISLPVSLLINDINISGYSSLEFRIHLAEDDASDGLEDWDNPVSGVQNYVHINYDIDNSSSFSNLLWINPNGTGLNYEPAIDTDFDGTGDGTTITNTFTQFTQNIAGTGSLLDISIEFNLNDGDEDIAIDNIEIWGTLIPCASTVTWNGSLPWVGGSPGLSTIVELNADYDTASFGSFSACSLNVNVGTLRIDNNEFVEIQNELNVAAGSSINVQPYGSFVQNNDLSVNNIAGDISVDKLTAPMDVWYEYTYWSSPVKNETIGNGLFESNVSRRFVFNAQNYLDAKKEVGNNNAKLDGQDDIDDDDNDWASVNGLTIMTPGIGYTSTHDQSKFIGPPMSYPPYKFIYTFEGEFNNGIITVPIYRNDSELNDINWNFIGNPYPSAIDADMFLAANSNISSDISGIDSGGNNYIDSAIFLWSQNTAPSSTANGNQQLNFSNDDYAIINLSGEVAGGDGMKPTRHIPSGQGFFISMSNTAPSTLVTGDVYTSDITFSNTMRITDPTANSQFFKDSNVKKKPNTVANKLWLDLTSDNGVYNQILVGYVNGATNNDDGMAYDTNKFPSKGAALYSTIEGSNKKFAIQGKAANSINEDEVINLGFKTTIGVATLYKLSIAQLQGNFLTENTVFLKDNLLNKTHNLSASDYTFTSEVGEFNARFEIVFNANALSTDDLILNEKLLSIVELENDDVQFRVSNDLKITSVGVFDLLGRQLYQFKGQNNTETYNLSDLSSTVYVAKVTLSNGAVITKKAVKK